MGNTKLIFAIIVVLGLIIGIIFGFLYMQDNSKQASVLQQEISSLLEKDFINSEIDMTIKSKRNYAKVEKAVKDYLSDVKSLYAQAQKFCDDSEISNIISAENIEADDKELTVLSQKIEEYKNEFEELKNSSKGITNELIILEKIEATGVKQNYVDVYKDIMDNESMKSKLENAQSQIEKELEKTEKQVDGLDKIVRFLKFNSKYWEINDGRLQFTNVNKLTEYYQLLNGD